jgi:hypothetical protein
MSPKSCLRLVSNRKRARRTELRKFQGLETEKWKKIVADEKIEPE